MRSFVIATTVAWLSLLFPAASAASADDDSTGWMSDGNALYITAGLGTFNTSNDPATARWRDDFGYLHRRGRNIAVDAGVFIVRSISTGFRYGNHGATYYTRNEFLGFDLEDKQYETTVNEVLFDVRGWLPPRRGVILGVAAGYGQGKLEGNGHKWTENGAVYEFYGGAAFALGDGNTALAVVRAGYALRDYGTVDLGDGTDPALATSLDLSGWFLEFNFGGIAKINNN